MLHEGEGRYFVEDRSFDAEAGDIVIIPPEAEHSFINTGSGPLRHTAIHEAPAQASTFTDGSGL